MFKCKICGKETETIRGLKLHKSRMHHGAKIEPDEDIPPEKPEKPKGPQIYKELNEDAPNDFECFIDDLFAGRSRLINQIFFSQHENKVRVSLEYEVS